MLKPVLAATCLLLPVVGCALVPMVQQEDLRAWEGQPVSALAFLGSDV